MTTYEQIFQKNKEWISSKTRSDKEYFEKMAKSQEPEFLYIGCSDSRVPANNIMGLEPGEVFVHRNIANLVINNDLNVMSVINYAVEHLNVKYVIVCGHYNCGGVKAAMDRMDLGMLNPWIRNIRDVYRLHQEELDSIKDNVERYNRLVELNVIEQCINVLKTAEVQKSYIKTGYPKVAGWVYNLHDGKLIDLNFDFEESMKNIRKIYDLFEDKSQIT